MNYDSQSWRSSARLMSSATADGSTERSTEHSRRRLAEARRSPPTADLHVDGGRPSASGGSPWVQKYGVVLVSLLILAVVAAGAYYWADALQYSVFTYQSPLSVVQIPPGEPRSIPAHSHEDADLLPRVVVVIIGGLNYDMAHSEAMPNLGALFESGASAPMVSRPPTYSPSAWTTLVTGVWPDLNNAPIGETDMVGLRPLALDDVLAAAGDAGLRMAFAGSWGWEGLLGAGSPDASFYTADEDAVGDGEVAQAALGFMADPGYDLVLVHFSQVDAAGRTEGAASDAYAGAARQVDRHLRQITRLVGSSGSVLIVTSDHGRLGDGRLGGGESDLTRLPFVMVGPDIIPGDYSPVRQVDLAPTVTALLGTRLPAAAQGRPLYEMIQFDQETLAFGRQQLAVQKVALGDAYLMAIGRGGLSQETHEDLVSAQQALLSGNRAGALQLADLVAEEAMAEMTSAKAARIAGERLRRLGVVVVALLLPLLVTLRLLHPIRGTPRLWGRLGQPHGRDPHPIRGTPHLPARVGAAQMLVNLVGGGIATASYYGLYRLGGYTFSLSAVDDPGVFVTSLARYAGIGVGVGGLLVMAGLLYRDERSWAAAMATGYGYGLFTVYLSALPALAGYWQHGAVVRWYLPDLGLTLLHFMALVQVASVAVLAIPLPWLVALVVWGIGRWRTHAEARVQAWDPIARLRRR